MKDMTLEQWQENLLRYTRENPNAKPGAAFRIDNTPFSTARHYGGFTYNGDEYHVVYFSGGELLGVRDDFMKWAKKINKKEKEASSK